MKELAPPFYFQMGCAEWFGEYVYQFWSINSKNCEIYEHLTENIVAGVSKLCSTTVPSKREKTLLGSYFHSYVPVQLLLTSATAAGT